MHVHVSALDLLITALYFVIISFFLRILAAKNSENSFGKALAFIN